MQKQLSMLTSLPHVVSETASSSALLQGSPYNTSPPAVSSCVPSNFSQLAFQIEMASFFSKIVYQKTLFWMYNMLKCIKNAAIKLNELQCGILRCALPSASQVRGTHSVNGRFFFHFFFSSIFFTLKWRTVGNTVKAFFLGGSRHFITCAHLCLPSVHMCGCLSLKRKLPEGTNASEGMCVNT